MRIYTRTGDSGRTSLLGGERVLKHHDRIEACGDIDELNAWLGVVLNHDLDAGTAEAFRRIQSDLFHIGACLSATSTARGSTPFTGVPSARIEDLESAIDRMCAELPPLTAFILPGGGQAAAWTHVARSVCRRAERRVVQFVQAEESDEQVEAILRYLNRLSDYLFTAARYCNQQHGVCDAEWHK